MGTNKDGEEGIILRKIKRHGSRERQGTPLLQESADHMYVEKTQRTKESRDELPFRRLKRQGRHVWEQRLRKDFIKAADSQSSLEVKGTETLRAFDLYSLYPENGIHVFWICQNNSRSLHFSCCLDLSRSDQEICDFGSSSINERSIAECIYASLFQTGLHPIFPFNEGFCTTKAPKPWGEITFQPNFQRVFHA